MHLASPCQNPSLESSPFIPAQEPKAQVKAQIKDKERVRDFGEVFTAEREVNAMLDLLPESILHSLDSTYLEPSCGDGNFLVAILARKLALARLDSRPLDSALESKPTAPAFSPLELDILRALGSIYGVEILPDNLLCARRRLFTFAARFYASHAPTPRLSFLRACASIVRANLICTDFLQNDMRFCFYDFDADFGADFGAQELGETQKRLITITMKPISTLLDPSSLLAESSEMSFSHGDFHLFPRLLRAKSRHPKHTKPAKPKIAKPKSQNLKPKAPKATSLFGDML